VVIHINFQLSNLRLIKKLYIHMKKQLKQSYMDIRTDLLGKIEGNLSDMFVDEYDKVNQARLSVNVYLKDIELGYQYEYNDFCKDFMTNSKNLINQLSDERLRELNNSIFVTEVISFMIKNKIYEKVEDVDRRSYLMIQHELKKFLMNQ
jgi:hypothetical protein